MLRESTLPADVETGDRLVVLSYSGNTRESLTLWREASRAGLRRGAVASGGALLEAARSEGCPSVVVPGGLAPRLALGHLLRGAADLAGTAAADWTGGAEHLRGIRRSFQDGTPVERLLADLVRTVPAVLSGNRIAHAAARRWSASLAENAKIASFHWPLPEAAHNAIMALSRGAPRRRDLTVIALGQPEGGEAGDRWESLLGTLRDEGAPAAARAPRRGPPGGNAGQGGNDPRQCPQVPGIRMRARRSPTWAAPRSRFQRASS